MDETITITFGDQAENHVGMQIIGQMADSGFTLDDLLYAHDKFIGCRRDYYQLNFSPELPEAAILVIRKGVDFILNNVDNVIVFQEQRNLNWDTKAYMRGRVVNKHARYNLCYGDRAQEPNYEEKRGRVVPFEKIPLTRTILERLPYFFGPKANGLVAEGNYYYSSKDCYIGFHGDSERKRVIAMRLGAPMSLYYRWYQNSETFGPVTHIILEPGDMYIMSEKAVGTDWKKRIIPTLRHAAGIWTKVK
jgi:hypothetical protein